MAKQRFSVPARRGPSCEGFGRFIVLSVTLLLFSNHLLAGQQGTSESLQYKIFPLKYIPVEQGRKYLADIKIGTVSHIPGSAALLVTAKPDELLKAMAILNLVDCQGQFAVRTAFGASMAKNLPSNELVAAKVGGNISIGSFFNPPAVNAKVRAIIDIHNDAVIVIAPVRTLERILSAVRQVSNPGNRLTQGKWKAPELARPDVSGLHFAAKGKIPTQPNTVPTILEQEMPELPAAVQPYETEPISNGDDILQLALPETLTITDFLGFVGEHLNLNYLYDPLKIKGNITLKRHGKLRGPIKLKELYPLLEQVMQFYGFAMTRRGDLVTIVPATEAQSIDPDLYPDAKDIEIGDAVITRVFKLQHIDTTNAKNFLDAMRLVTEVRPIPETRTLIVTAFAYRMPRIEALLKMVDKPGEPKKFRFRELQYTIPQMLTPKIQTLAEHLGTISITIAAAAAVPYKPSPKRPGETEAVYRRRISQERSAFQRAATTRAAATRRATPTAPTAERAKPTVYLDADERTNRILMIGLDEQLDEVEELIDTLDVAQQDLRTLKLYKI